MRVCYFGIYDSTYSRNRILISGLLQNGVEVLECNSRRHGIIKYFDIAKKHWHIRKEYDAMVVGFPGYQAMILARFLTRKPIIFDCFTSLYDSMVWDRKTAKSHSIAARYCWFLDWLSMKLADIILFDTETHINYASTEFRIPKEKFRRVWIGATTDIFFPRPPTQTEEVLRKGVFSVLFFGTFIPLQGIEYIVESAKLLEEKDVVFRIIGDGQEREKILMYAESKQVKNIEFVDKMPQEKLVTEIANVDMCLGIFGNTAKTQRVIPNKVYECLAMKKPVITADTPAIRELFNDEDVFFVKAADSTSLANGILRLINDKKTMEEMTQNGYDSFIANATPTILGKELKGIIEETIQTNC